jgi:hypothetical protein
VRHRYLRRKNRYENSVSHYPRTLHVKMALINFHPNPMVSARTFPEPLCPRMASAFATQPSDREVRRVAHSRLRAGRGPGRNDSAKERRRLQHPPTHIRLPSSSPAKAPVLLCPPTAVSGQWLYPDCQTTATLTESPFKCSHHLHGVNTSQATFSARFRIKPPPRPPPL